MKRVLIIAEGQWGLVKREAYQTLIEMFRRALDEAKEPYGSEGQCAGHRKAAKVEVVATADKAEQIIKSASINDKIDSVVFVSRGMEREAERIAKENPKVRVVVSTGLIPEGKVIWARKGVVDIEAIRNIVLYY